MKRYINILSAVSAAVLLAPLSSCGTVVERAGSPDSQMFTTTGTNVSASSQTDSTTTVSTETKKSDTDVMRGSLIDANGKILMYSMKDDSGKEVRITNDANKIAFANVLNESRFILIGVIAGFGTGWASVSSPCFLKTAT